MKTFPIHFLCFCGSIAAFNDCAAQTPDFTGRWNVVIEYAANTASMELQLEQRSGKYTGSSKSPDLGMTLTFEGSVRNGRLELTPFAEARFKRVAAPQSTGTLELEIKNGRLSGAGILYNMSVALTGVRPDEKSAAPRTHYYAPARYTTILAGRNEPVLHIRPGDSVSTTTVDAFGLDENRQWRSIPGNPHTGPFYIEGAMPGDTLVVELTRVRVNQSRAAMICDGLNANAVPVQSAPKADDQCDRMWSLDAASGYARPEQPSSRLKNFRVPLRPMVGSIGVAPPYHEAISAADLRRHGGNLDYNRITEGVTLYFPVFRAGALFSLGDGHAAQGDGEITGQGLETSLAVEFKVDLIKGKAPHFPWAEDDEFVMFSGIGNSMSEALQAGTAGMVDWLEERYQLGTADIAMILGTSIQYDVAEIVDPRPHIVARLDKDVLAQIHSQ